MCCKFKELGINFIRSKLKKVDIDFIQCMFTEVVNMNCMSKMVDIDFSRCRSTEVVNTNCMSKMFDIDFDIDHKGNRYFKP